MTDVFFIAISGAHSYGWAKADSDVDLRLVWAPKWELAVSMKRREMAKETQFLAIDYTAYSLHEFLRQLIKGNGNRLENLFQDKLFEDKQAVAELQKLAMEHLHLGYLKHYLGYSNHLVKDMENASRIEKYGMRKLLLDTYRVLQAGLILAHTNKVVYHLPSQGKYALAEYPSLILRRYLEDEPVHENIVHNSTTEIEVLQDELSHAINESSWPKRATLDTFDDWLIDYYNRMRR